MSLTLEQSSQAYAQRKANAAQDSVQESFPCLFAFLLISVLGGNSRRHTCSARLMLPKDVSRLVSSLLHIGCCVQDPRLAMQL